MSDRTSVQQIERISGLRVIIRRWKFIPLFMAFAVCLCGGCGQAQHLDTGKAVVEEELNIDEKVDVVQNFSQEENDNSVIELEGNKNENKKVNVEEDFSDHAMDTAFPDNDSIKDSIYHYYGREAHEKISEDEIEAVRGKLPAYSLTIHSGEEFALMREWYNWDDVHIVTVYFSKDLREWQEEELQALEILNDTVYVESDTGTFPVHALTYLTGAQDVYFSANTDVEDVTGTLPKGTCFPKQIKSVTFFQYREGKYSALLRALEDSQVETITIRPDSGAKESLGFWLDDVVGISTLKELNLENIAIRTRDASLEGCDIVRIKGDIDKDTDLCFVEDMVQLEEVTGRIVDVRDLSPFLDRKGLSLYLNFCRETSVWNEESSEGSIYTVCPDFDKEVGWTEEAEGFLGIYQRREDQGRIVECFTERSISREEDMYMYDPWMRVTDGMTVYELRPGEERGGDFGFGSGRTDRVSFEDINFDGVKDIVLDAGGFGNQGLHYEFGYLWNQRSGRYEFSPTYTMIGNPSVDVEHQLVRSSWRNWAASHSWAIYRYVDGEFVMQSMLTEEPLDEDDIPAKLEVPEGAEVWCWQEEIMENGQVVEEKYSYAVTVEGEETVYPEEYESYYEEDSYWGYGY